MSVVRKLKRDYPDAVIVANGGIQTVEQSLALLTPAEDTALPAADGVMLGRAAYHDPWVLRDIAQAIGHTNLPNNRESILSALQKYFEDQLSKGTAPKHMTRHWHGLFHGQPGARVWRREICEGKLGPLALFEQLKASAHESAH